MRTDILERKEEIERWIAEGKTKAQMARDLDCNPKTINAVLSKAKKGYGNTLHINVIDHVDVKTTIGDLGDLLSVNITGSG